MVLNSNLVKPDFPHTVKLGDEEGFDKEQTRIKKRRMDRRAFGGRFLPR